MTHTPGLWMIDAGLVYALGDNRDRDGRLRYTADGKPEQANRMSCRIEYFTRSGGSQKEADANANLIAASPDLLEACHAVCHAFSLQSHHGLETKLHEAYDKCRAAIKKAEAL